MPSRPLALALALSPTVRRRRRHTMPAAGSNPGASFSTAHGENESSSSSSRRKPPPPITRPEIERLRATAEHIPITYSWAKFWTHVSLLAALTAHAATCFAYSPLSPTPASDLAASNVVPEINQSRALLPTVIPWPLSGVLGQAPAPLQQQQQMQRHYQQQQANDQAASAAANALPASLAALVYLALALVAALAPLAVRLERVLHVYALWPVTAWAIHAAFAHASALPLLALAVYVLRLRLAVTAVNLWYHARSYSHMKALPPPPSPGTLAAGPLPSATRRQPPFAGAHLQPEVRLASRAVLAAFHAWSLGGGAYIAAAVLAGSNRTVSPWACLAAWIAVRWMVSMYSFQIACVVWVPAEAGDIARGKRRREGVIVWQSRSSGWRAGVLC
ncbi:hypothetical protein BC828DRAFT_402004 [Blastocladiella britannica]|nr:hypothetical protein BC828DRAFT_402004 [Blastocladiella britannica]